MQMSDMLKGDPSGNAERGKLPTSDEVSVELNTTTPSYIPLDRDQMDAEQCLRKYYTYRAEERSKAVTETFKLKKQERTSAFKKRIEAAKKRAIAARKKMDLATRDSDIANLDLEMITAEAREVDEQIQMSEKYHINRPTEKGFRKYETKVRKIELFSDDSA